MDDVLSQATLENIKTRAQDARDAQHSGLSVTNQFLAFVAELKPELVITMVEELQRLRKGALAAAAPERHDEQTPLALDASPDKYTDRTFATPNSQAVGPVVIHQVPSTHVPNGGTPYPAAGSMEDFAEAGRLIGRIVNSTSNGEALGHILMYRREIRQQCFASMPAPRPPNPDDFELAEEEPSCWCRTCNEDRTDHGLPFNSTRFIVCPSCGNKRCPKATDHTFECTNSNEPGQPGSVFKLAPATVLPVATHALEGEATLAPPQPGNSTEGGPG